MQSLRLSILLFDRFTALDVVGGYEVLARLPGVETDFVSTEPGIIAADTRRLGMVTYRKLAEQAKASLRSWTEHSEPAQLQMSPPWAADATGR